MNINELKKSISSNRKLSDVLFIFWAGGAALLSYSLVYALRKPFTAATFDGLDFFGMDYKTVTSIVQIFGYFLSKLIGIKVISELKKENRLRFIILSVASVLSSLYSSVLPTYLSGINKGENEEDALDYALSQVNNISKKRLLGNLQELKTQLFRLEPNTGAEEKANPFLNMLTEEMQNSVQEVYNYSGIYISYSLSSSSHSLKVEPYLISASENNSYVRVMHMNTYNTTHCGIGMFSNHQNAYIMFNEREMPQMALFTIYLQLPMYDFPHMLKGLYLCLDYNRNPIARRILFIKHSDSTNIDDFLLLKGRLVSPEELTDEIRPYYDYTCQPGDYIKTCNVPSPLLNAKDLDREKRMLEI